MGELYETWVYLSASPLFHLTLTLCAFQLASLVFEKTGRTPLLNPVLVAVIIVVAVLKATETDYATYFQGAQFVHFLLGPATVSLAIPLHRHWALVRRSAPAILASLLTGSLAAIVSAAGIAALMGAAPQVVASIAPKSVTAPVAMAVTEQIGGLPSLTAVLVLATGVCGAMFGPAVLDLLRVRGEAARGIAMGTASHGIGTARALQLSQTAGAFAGLAMGLNGLATALLLPLVWRIFF